MGYNYNCFHSLLTKGRLSHASAPAHPSSPEPAEPGPSETVGGQATTSQPGAQDSIIIHDYMLPYIVIIMTASLHATLYYDGYD